MASKLLAIAASVAVAQAVAQGGKVTYAGVNIAGFDFGCPDPTGVYTADLVDPPLSGKGSADGVGQMKHFANDDGLNVFRLPVCWQYLISGDDPNGSVNKEHLSTYDELVQGCLSSGASCVLDIHNYARWENQIIGQSAITDDSFVKIWTELAKKYSSEDKIIFGVMNEPHDLNIKKWANTVQKVVTAIRNAGAKSQTILLPGTEYTSLGAYETESAPAMGKVTNPGGDAKNLVFDVHQYLDEDSSGTHTDCTQDGVASIHSLAKYLRQVKRQAFLTETGGGNTQSCYKNLCAELDTLNYNADVFLGWIGWAAGSFSGSYELLETPVQKGGKWNDKPIVSKCVAGLFK